MNLSFHSIQMELQNENIKADFITRIYNENVQRCNLVSLKKRAKYVVDRYRVMTSGTGSFSPEEKKEIKDDYNNLEHMYSLIQAEIRDNIWYFLSEVVEVPEDCYYTMGKPLFEIYHDAADPERPNALKLSKWMVFYFHALHYDIPFVMESFEGFDFLLGAALLLVYEFIVNKSVYAKTGMTLCDGRADWREVAAIIVKKESFILKYKLEYIVARILDATFKAWDFLPQIYETKSCIDHIGDLYVSPTSYTEILNQIAFKQTIILDCELDQHSMIEVLMGRENTRIDKVKKYGESYTLPTFISLNGQWASTIRVIASNTSYSIFNITSVPNSDSEAWINMLTGNRAKPVLFTTNFNDYKSINNERFDTITKLIPKHTLSLDVMHSKIYGKYLTKKDFGLE